MCALQLRRDVLFEPCYLEILYRTRIKSPERICRRKRRPLFVSLFARALGAVCTHMGDQQPVQHDIPDLMLLCAGTLRSVPLSRRARNGFLGVRAGPPLGSPSPATPITQQYNRMSLLTVEERKMLPSGVYWPSRLSRSPLPCPPHTELQASLA